MIDDMDNDADVCVCCFFLVGRTYQVTTGIQ